MVEIKSNVLGRLAKVRKGVVYQSVNATIGEGLQNCQRAKATEVQTSIFDDGTLVIFDNGIGCRDPQVLFELDTSGWELAEAFGEGFSSVFAVADTIRVQSHNWIAEVDVVDVIEKGDLKVRITKTEDFVS